LGGEEGEEAEGGKELPGGWVEGLRDGARAHRAAGLTMLEQQESQLCDSEARSQAHTVSPLHLQRHKIIMDQRLRCVSQSTGALLYRQYASTVDR
jgi:hypothetical protein